MWQEVASKKCQEIKLPVFTFIFNLINSPFKVFCMLHEIYENRLHTGEHSKYSMPLEFAYSRPCLVDITLLCFKSVFIATKAPKDNNYC